MQEDLKDNKRYIAGMDNYGNNWKWCLSLVAFYERSFTYMYGVEEIWKSDCIAIGWQIR
jgi:hypothetical protein